MQNGPADVQSSGDIDVGIDIRQLSSGFFDLRPPSLWPPARLAFGYCQLWQQLSANRIRGRRTGPETDSAPNTQESGIAQVLVCVHGRRRDFPGVLFLDLT